MARAIALLLLLAVLALQTVRATRAAFEYYPYLKLHGDEVQTTREALLYHLVGRGQSLNYVYGGAYPTVLSTVLRFTPPGRLPADAALGLAKQSAPIFHIWGRLLSLVWSLVAIAAIYFAARANAPPLVAVACAAVPCAFHQFLFRASGCLIDMQAIALIAISVACLANYARSHSATALTLGAAAFGMAVSTKYNAGFLLIGWLVALARPRAAHFIRLAVVAAVVFFLFSPQIALHPADALAGLRGEAKHQRSGFTASQLGHPYLWMFTTAPGECGVWLMTACALAGLARSPLRPMAVAFLADLVIVANGGFQMMHYLMPSFSCGLACVAGIAATRPARIPARVTLLGVVLAGAYAINADAQRFARPDTRKLMRAHLTALPPGTRLLLGVPPEGEPEVPLSVIPVYRFKTGSSLTDIWRTAAELTASPPDAVLISLDLLDTLDLICARHPGEQTPYHVERAALGAFWPPNDRYRELVRLVPTPEQRGPRYVLLTSSGSSPRPR